MVVASGLLAIIVGGAFAVVLLTITELRGTTNLRRQTREELVAADTVEKQIIDLETGLRGFVITHDESFLQPSNDARAALPKSARELERLAADEPVQHARIQRIVRAMNAYISQYAMPLVGAVRRDDPSVHSVASTEAGKRRVDALREGLGSFRDAERARLGSRDEDVDVAARRATVAAAVGVAGSIVLIIVFSGYLTRVIVRPVRRAAVLAHRLAGGDLSARMHETDVAEIGELGQSFNVMAGSVESSRDELASLLAEQAALRRVATLVAHEAPQAEVFASIAEEIEQLLGTEGVRMVRYEDDRSAVVVANSGIFTHALPVGSGQPLGGKNVLSRVFRTGEPARIDDYSTASGPIADSMRAIGVRSVVATPIVVAGRLWGSMSTGTTRDHPLPPETEARLGQFTEFMATAIANTDSRAEVVRLAAEQAALRRLATLVAEGGSPGAVFDAAAEQMEGLLDAHQVALGRYEAGAAVTLVAYRGANASRLPAGTRISLEGDSAMASVRRTGRSVRVEFSVPVEGAIGEIARELGVRVSVGAPIVVDGRLWGVIQASWNRDEPPPADTEQRMAQFAELLDTAIANADARDQLTASRARLVTEEDEARRRVVRDLHDGAQQRLVHTIITLKLAQQAFRDDDGDPQSLIAEALRHAKQGNDELRELAHGILPAALSRGGVRAGVDAVVTRLDLPVHVDVPAERFPAEIEATAYFVIAEALTNVVKHSQAERAEVRASVHDRNLRIEVRDDGAGGADPDGHGLVGMADRATALGGRLEVQSPAGGGGTRVTATLPLPG
jgi:signal transduction histidine kinase/CHASE3 domain sensor protein